MRLAAPFFADQIRRKKILLNDAKAIICSSFLDVAVFKGMLPLAHRHLPIHVYFHENQFAYPVQQEDSRDVHFALTNLSTALAADRLAFNSSYNLESFLSGCKELLAKNNDMGLADYQDEIRAKSHILPLAFDFSAIDSITTSRKSSQVPVLLWNHRWEHDKNPEIFFQTLFDMQARGTDFQLIVLGESFRQMPKIFCEAQQVLADRILHFGYAPSRTEYYKWLSRADVVISTAIHEFFGISILEAVRTGCRPLLPKRLAYPEIFPDEFLYEDHEFADRLSSCMKEKRMSRQQSKELTEPFSWGRLNERYEDWLAL